MQNPDGSVNISAEFIGNINSYKYRSYYFDTETDLYYLQSRYYDPEIGRFISQDEVSYLAPDIINGLNLYTYCGNNPVMRLDQNGNDWNSFWKTVLGVAIGIGLAAVSVIAVIASGGALLVPVLVFCYWRKYEFNRSRNW